MLPFPMRSAPILARSLATAPRPVATVATGFRWTFRPSDLPTFRRSDKRSSLFPITSLQPLHFHAIAHSFAQRRHVISPAFSSLRTLLPLTANIFSPTHYFSSALFSFQASSLKPRVLKDLQPLGHLQKSQVLCNQANPASFCKTPGWGVSTSLKPPASRLQKCYLLHP